jgi:hypothetical protein
LHGDVNAGQYKNSNDILTGFNHFDVVAPFPQDFLDAMFALISYIISSQTGGNMVISAGLVPVLLQLLSNKHSSQLKVRI